MTMSNKEAMEKHRKIIASLGTSGLENTANQAFLRSAEKNETKEFRGVCPECKQSFVPGYAVRCSHEECDGLIFHPACFGSHTMHTHQPSNVPVVVKRVTDDVYQYVDDVDVSFSHKITEPDMARVPFSTDDAGKDTVVDVKSTDSSLPDEELFEPSAEKPEIKVPSGPTLSGSMTDEEKDIRAKKNARRSQG